MTARTNGDARPDGVTLLDKVQFFNWACEQHPLEAADMNVLRVIVFKVLGLNDGKPHNGWCTASKLAMMCGLTDRTVRRALDRLQGFGLVKCIGTRGRHGNTVLHVAGVVGAAEKLPQRKLTDRDGEDNEPQSKLGRSRPNKTVEIRTQPSAKLGRRRPMNPIQNHIHGSEPLERVSGGAANGSVRPRARSDSCGLGGAATCGHAASRMASTVTVRRRRSSRRRSAGTCWLWRERRRRKLRSSS
jgi:hypothetical protein